MSRPSIKSTGGSDWSFQEDAIASVVRYYEEEPFAKNLLVIPTGGGKTLTALRAISRLLDIGRLSNEDRVLWTVHSKTLRDQAEEALIDIKNIKKFHFNKYLNTVVEVRMKEAARAILAQDTNRSYKLLVIDEAHHSAANTYREFFNDRIGILGLTATPTRADESVLNFDRVAYSITFSELIDRRVILMPEFLPPVNTGRTIRLQSLDYSDLGIIDEQYNTDFRNRIISEYIVKKRDIFTKVIIFVPTNNHVDSLFEKLSVYNELYGNQFHVGYIYSEERNGRSNDKGLKNEEYLKWHKNYTEPSILINCAMLNEGYDDPNIDTVVMAVPTRSILYYMQCIGRVVRNPGDKKTSKARVVEFVDNLPNFVYRIDNKWLFADISDYLEPKVIEVFYSTRTELKNTINKCLSDYNVLPEYIEQISDFGSDLVSLMLLKPTLSEQENRWIPLLFNVKNRELYTHTFNEICNNINEYQDIEQEYLFHERLKVPRDDFYFKSGKYKSDLIHALKKANSEKKERREIKRIIYINYFKITKDNWWTRLMRWFRRRYTQLISVK